MADGQRVALVAFAPATPGDELLLADGIGIGGVVGEDGVGLGRSVAVDGHLARTSVKVGRTRGIDDAADNVVAKVREVVGQQVVGLNIHVESNV